MPVKNSDSHKIVITAKHTRLRYLVDGTTIVSKTFWSRSRFVGPQMIEVLG